MVLTPAQEVIAQDTHRFRVLNCGRRFGKTTLAIEEIKGKGLSGPSRIAYIAPTYQQARDIAWEALKRELHSVALAINESRLEIRIRTVKGGESLIVLRGWESIETLRGQKFDFVVIDEIAQMRNFWVNWHEVIRPTLTDTVGEGLFISTPKGFDHFYELFCIDATQAPAYKNQEQDTDYKSFHYTTYDNPHLKVEEINKARAEVGENRFAQEYMADFRKMEGLVYQEFDRNTSVFNEAPQFIADTMMGVDFGFTNPCAAITILKDHSDTFWITEEYYETKRTDAEVAEYVAAKSPNKVYPDPESPGAIEELRKRGVHIREVIKGKDSVENGISRVRELLKVGKLKVHSSCVNTIREFETYAYPDKKPDKNEYEVPIDEDNHAMDAIRYVIMMNVGSGGVARQFYPSHAKQTTTDIARNPLAPHQARSKYPTRHYGRRSG